MVRVNSNAACDEPEGMHGVHGGQGRPDVRNRVEASSLFDAAARALEQWSRLWWYRPNGFVEVRMGDKCWRVSAERVREWRSQSK